MVKSILENTQQLSMLLVKTPDAHDSGICVIGRYVYANSPNYVTVDLRLGSYSLEMFLLLIVGRNCVLDTL